MPNYKTLTVVFCSVAAVSLVCAGIAFLQKPGTPDLAEGSAPAPSGVTVVRAADQTEVTRPDGFPDPEGNWVKLPEGINLAEGKAVDAGEVTEVYAASNTVDGDATSYWESKGLPAEITVDLAGDYTVQTVGVRLNPAPIWEARTQNFSILLSTDGVNFTSAVPDERYEFNPDTGNIVRVDFTPAAARYVRLVFSAISSGRSNGAQASEIVIYG
ncbi:MAG: discoidin domain-containing protein [Oscillospiraceae bacterium]|jgi:hypothetical protein|nr:discoidin domain-containing protein [Oscillospiraceae bacterium]